MGEEMKILVMMMLLSSVSMAKNLPCKIEKEGDISLYGGCVEFDKKKAIFYSSIGFTCIVPREKTKSVEKDISLSLEKNLDIRKEALLEHGSLDKIPDCSK